ncbi:MAG: hypothetical protein CMP09_22530 [Yangia sp.]|nr:hypothetical protein [Salipiger sp.]
MTVTMFARKPVLAAAVALAVLAGCRDRYDRVGERLARGLIKSYASDFPEHDQGTYLPGLQTRMATI